MPITAGPTIIGTIIGADTGNQPDEKPGTAPGFLLSIAEINSTRVPRNVAVRPRANAFGFNSRLTFNQ